MHYVVQPYDHTMLSNLTLSRKDNIKTEKDDERSLVEWIGILNHPPSWMEYHLICFSNIK